MTTPHATAALLFDIDRPAYSVPSMGEIRARDNGLTAVSTFSGCGGSSTGLHMAGWRIPWANEFIPAARETYEANWPETYVDPRDIREIEPGDILDRIGLRRGELDLFEGSPPCSSFALVNNRREKAERYGSSTVKDYSEGVKQATDDLFDEWLRLVDGLMPRAVIAENVPGLVIGEDSRDFYLSILSRLEALGYRPHGDVYNAMHYGSGTYRKRLVIRAVRRDVGDVPPRPRRTEAGHSLQDVLDSLPQIPSSEEISHASAVGYAIGDEWARIDIGEWSKRYTQVIRCDPADPLPGITQTGQGRGAANPMHPHECRKFTPTELAWAFGYPADYVWPGTPAQRYERIGRSVAPPLYRAHGEALADALKGATA